MKRVTITFTYDFDDDTPDDTCYASAIEAHGQEDIDDNNIKLENLPNETTD
jgi:hypothetical protein